MFRWLRTIMYRETFEEWVKSKVEVILCELRLLKGKVDDMANSLDQKIDDLKTQVAGQTTVIQSAVTLLNGIGQRIQDAVQAALAAGATAEELAAMTDLGASLGASTQQLADAVAANTPTGPTAARTKP